ncbi:hypothetical protein FEM08_06570 [Flavobacterium gilvum]|nr:hypothetical protein FEM08_06570 [Flavobacterium gilvum]
MKTKIKIRKIVAIDKKAIDVITFSARNSDNLNCFFRLSLVKLCFMGNCESILFIWVRIG